MNPVKRIAVVAAGLREPSSTRLLADGLANATLAALADRGVPAEVFTVNLRDHAHDLVNALLAGFPSPALAAVYRDVAGADGLIAVTPVFSGSYNALFKAFFDLVDEGTMAGLPTLVGATGGTPRHSLAIEHAVKPLLAYLRAEVVPTGVYAATDDFGAVETKSADGEAPLAVRIRRASGELANRVAGAPPRRVPYLFELTVDFEDLLGGR